MSIDAMWVAGWFLCGIFGSQIAQWTEQEGDPPPGPWAAVFGPLMLICSLCITVLIVVHAKKDAKS